jgi:hypothetical protein
MAERQTGTQQVQIAPEVTPGTGVAATKKLQSMDFTINPTGEVLQFKPQGSKLPTVVIPGQEWTDGALSGRPVYDELIYPLSMIFGAPTPTTVAVTGKLWTFTYNPATALTPKTFTVEKGSAVRAGKSVGVGLTDFGVHITRNEVTVDGAVLGQLYTDGITMTATPTTLPQQPVLPGEWNIYIDDTFGAIGTTKWLRAFSLDVNMSGLYSAIWPINTALTSYATTVENNDPTITMDLRVEADATGMGLLTSLRAGATKYIRAKAVSLTTIPGSTAFYQFGIDAAVKLADFSDFDDEDGLYVRDWPLQVVNDSSISLEIIVQCGTAAL